MPVTGGTWYTLGPAAYTTTTTATAGMYLPAATWPDWSLPVTGTGTAIYTRVLEPRAEWELFRTTAVEVVTTTLATTVEATEREIQRQAAERRRLERNERGRAAAIERRSRANTARSRAEDLLMAHLDDQQQSDVSEHWWFEVISDLGRRWRIHTDHYAGNVDLMPDVGEERLATFCAHGSAFLPDSDHHLIQKLALETDEAAFLAVANCQYRSREYAA